MREAIAPGGGKFEAHRHLSRLDTDIREPDRDLEVLQPLAVGLEARDPLEGQPAAGPSGP